MRRRPCWPLAADFCAAGALGNPPLAHNPPPAVPQPSRSAGGGGPVAAVRRRRAGAFLALRGAYLPPGAHAAARDHVREQCARLGADRRHGRA
eukprot:3344168-Prymnesium_polylepis.1